jgi:hypothetical protein
MDFDRFCNQRRGHVPWLVLAAIASQAAGTIFEGFIVFCYFLRKIESFEMLIASMNGFSFSRCLLSCSDIDLVWPVLPI